MIPSSLCFISTHTYDSGNVLYTLDNRCVEFLDRWFISSLLTLVCHQLAYNMADSISNSSDVVIGPVDHVKYGSVPLKVDNADEIVADEEVIKSHQKKTIFSFNVDQAIYHLIIAIGLAIATYVGVASRIYLSNFSKWDGVQHFPSFWAQIIGTFIIGILVAHKEVLSKNCKVLYVSLSTGLCGSLTTFSSWNAEASIVLLHLNESSLNTSQTVDNPANRIVGSFTILILGVGMPLASVLLGKNIALQWKAMWLNDISTCYKINIHRLLIGKMWLVLFIITICYVLSTTAIAVSCILTYNFPLLFSLVFGGFGTYIRWRLSYFDNCSASGFPFGTLLANSIGSILLAGIIVSKTYVVVEATADDMVLAVLIGVATGFCGSLTTVSTFITQLCTLPFHIGLLYSLVSLAISQVLFTLILGTYSWTKF